MIHFLHKPNLNVFSDIEVDDVYEFFNILMKLFLIVQKFLSQ